MQTDVFRSTYEMKVRMQLECPHGGTDNSFFSSEESRWD
jgi:hypothetical protein